MNRAVGTPGGRALALLLLVVSTTAVAAFVVAPLWRLNENLDDRIAAIQERLEKQRRFVASSTGLESRLAQLKSAYARDSRFLRGPTRALAGAELQAIAKRVILSKGGSILSTQIVAAERDRRFTRVVLGVKMRAALEQTVEIFYALETGEPSLFLDNVGFTSRSNSRRSRRPTTPVALQAPALEVEFDLAGYLRGDMP